MVRQICYTSLPDKGWSTVNITPSLDADAVSQFARFQAAYAQEPRLAREDARTLYLFQTDEAWAYYTAVQYGHLDSFGRASRFAHGYVFPLGEFAANPGGVLKASRRNFRFGVQETAQTPLALEPLPPMDMRGAFETAKLDFPKYWALLQCVWNAFEKKLSDPLRVVCDCAEGTIRAVALAVCAALPDALRRRISFATANLDRPGGIALLFLRPGEAGARQFDLDSGRESTLTPFAKKQLENCAFIREAAELAMEKGSASELYERLDRELALHGAAGSASTEHLRLAYAEQKRKQAGAYEDADSRMWRLDSYLSAEMPRMECLDGMSAELLTGLLCEGHRIDAVVAEKINRRVEVSPNAAFREAGLQYNISVLKDMRPEEAAAYLDDAFKNRFSDAFLALRAELEKDPEGRRILNLLYLGFVGHSDRMPLAQKGESLALFRDFYLETQSLLPREPYEERVMGWLNAYFTHFQDRDPSLRGACALLREAEKDIAIFVGGALAEAWTQFARREIRGRFWAQFSFASFDAAPDSEFRKYYPALQLEGGEASGLVQRLFVLWDCFETGSGDDYYQFLSGLYTNFRKAPHELLRPYGDFLLKHFVGLCAENKAMVPAGEIYLWHYLARCVCKTAEEKAAFLLENNRFPAFTPELFPSAMARFKVRVRDHPDRADDLLAVMALFAKNKTPDGKRVAGLLAEYDREEKRGQKAPPKQTKLLTKLPALGKRDNRRGSGDGDGSGN